MAPTDADAETPASVVRTVKVRESDIAGLMDEDGCVVFDARRTVVARLLGLERARVVVGWGTNTLARLLVTANAPMVALAVVFLKFLGLTRTVGEGVMWAGVAVLVVWAVYLAVVGFDVAIIKLLVTTEGAVSKLALIASSRSSSTTTREARRTP